MTTLEQILLAAHALPADERAQLMASLWDDVSPQDWTPPHESWVAEADRRSQAIDAGEMSTSSWEEVRARARRKAGLDG